MSGFVGLVEFGATPIDERLLREMTSSLRFRGPDGIGMWSADGAGLGQATFATTPEARGIRSPMTLGEDAWIVADARVDDRTEMLRRLRGAGRPVSVSVSDTEIILHAYHLWGEACVEELLGDFSFAIWDARKRRLTLARDALGIKPLYYARTREGVVFSNTLATVRSHPSVGTDLNDLAVLDFLLFGHNREVGTTTFKDVDRVAPGHTVTFGPEGMRSRRHKSLPVPEISRNRRPGEYLEQFRALLEAAVADRLRTDRVAVFMSGGLDSTSLAAVARDQLAQSGGAVAAFTARFERAFVDGERRYAEMAAAHIGIPIEFVVPDEYRLFEGFDTGEINTPEPFLHPLYAATRDMEARAAGCARVAFNGEDPDALLEPTVVRAMLRSMPLPTVARDLYRFRRRYGRFPALGFGGFGPWGRKEWRPHYPQWLEPGLEAEFDARDRWEEQLRGVRTPENHPRPSAYRYLCDPQWQAFLESQDSGFRRVPLDVRLPFMDLRLIEFCLALPPLPWCEDKYILREAMRDRLPVEIRRRPKTVLQGHPPHFKLGEQASRWIDGWEPVPELQKYLRKDRVPRLFHGDSAGLGGIPPAESWVHLRCWSLNQWLSKRESNVPSSPISRSENESEVAVRVASTACAR